MKIKDLLKFGAESFPGQEGKLLDVELILAFVLGISREELITGSEDELDLVEIDLFKKYLDRLKNGEPVAYITTKKEFYGLDFFVDKRVLIPRPETELLVEETLNFFNPLIQFEEGKLTPKRKFNFLDIGTGSGNIAISVANYYQTKNLDIFENLDALDISEKALEVARINAQQHSVSNLIQFFQSDLLSAFEEREVFFDVIVTNLPYIGEEEFDFVDVSTEKFEPNSALYAGKDGLDLYRKLFEELREFPVDFEVMLGEFGFGQKNLMIDLLEKFYPGKYEICKDLAGIDRYFKVKK